jgi:hypothetical protein
VVHATFLSISNYPDARLNLIIEDAAAKFILVTPSIT